MNITMFAANPSPESHEAQPRQPEIHEVLPHQGGVETSADLHGEQNPEHNVALDKSISHKSSALIDAASKSHGSTFTSLAPEERAFVIKLHQNLGHPAMKSLVKCFVNRGMTQG